MLALLVAALLPIIPQPNRYRPGIGAWKAKGPLTIELAQSHNLDRLAGALAAYPDITVKRTARSANAALFAQRVDSLGSEGYKLEVSAKGISLQANSDTGLFYAAQSLLQLKQAARGGAIPACLVLDKPRFGYRGMMLDVCRHFFDVWEVKKLLDEMARIKLNTFHWHLTDDQGWRIEIKKYPKLAQIGSKRKGTLIGHYRTQPHTYDTLSYGGYFTQEQIKEVVAYAASRYITIIPEIEMPGHAQAALSAYPEFGVTGQPVIAKRDWGISNYIFNTDEATFQFLTDVLDEVIALFPGKYIHIGGDEAAKEQWDNSVKMQEQLKVRNVADAHELQSYFIKRIEKHLNAKGRSMLGWDEILEGGLAPNATVMVWRNAAQAKTVLTSYPNKIVVSFNSHLYLDAYQAEPVANEPLAIGGLTTLEKVYNFDVSVPGLTATQSHNILGAQANVWTEYIPTAQHLEYMIFPRLLALAEITWTQTRHKDFGSFRANASAYQSFLKGRGMNSRLD